MKNFLCLSLALLLPLTGYAGNGSGNVSQVVGGGGSSVISTQPGGSTPFSFAVSDLDSTKNIVLTASLDAVAGNFSCFYQQGGNGSCYRVPANKTLYWVEFKVASNDVGANQQCPMIGHSTGLPVDHSATTPAGTQVFYHLTSGTGLFVDSFCANAVAKTVSTYNPIGAFWPPDVFPLAKVPAGAGDFQFIIVTGYLK